MTRILVIKLGALGDMVLAAPFLKAIREHHADARVSALTTRPYADFLGRSGWVDQVFIDPRAPWWRPSETWSLLRRLRQAEFSRCYDLQGTQRTRLYYRGLRAGGLEWVGNAAGASHHHPDHAGARHLALHRRLQLALAGIEHIEPPDLGFLEAPIEHLGLPADYTLLAPGGAPHRPQKRWPALAYAALAERLHRSGSCPVLIGGTAEAAILAQIATACPGAINLGGRTSLQELGSLARGARAAIGNDTGPMHIIAAMNRPGVVLYGAASDPARIRPWGEAVAVLRAPRIADLSLDAVWADVQAVQQAGREPTPRPDQAM